MLNRKSLMPTILILLIVGFGGIARVTGRSAIRTVDVVQLTGSGVCLGVALISLFMLIRSPRE